MSLKSFCTTCQRVVYVDDEKTPICPVCSSPLLQTVDDPDDIEQDGAGVTDP